MAKRKRAPREKKVFQPTEVSVVQQTPDDLLQDDSMQDGSMQDTGSHFLGQWNQLVSTTNWEKGCIICGWREALMASGEAVTDYSDEAWAQLAGNVTSQHVGRLRRVYQRFGEVYDQYEGLYWSHFQAALDWDDAEMWLEGGIQNQWSVSQMRGKRWEALGTSPEEQQSETALDASEIDESPQLEAPSDATERSEAPTPSAKLSEDEPNAEASEPKKDSADQENIAEESQPALQVSKRTRLGVEVENLPDDLAEAFESFKLAIIAHRRESWSETSPEVVVECLEALRELALASEDPQ